MLKSDYIRAAAKMFGVHPRDITGPYRFQFILKPRFALSKALRERGWSYSEIGRLMKRDHSTIMHHIRKAEYFMERDPDYAAKIKTLARMQFIPEPAPAAEKPSQSDNILT